MNGEITIPSSLVPKLKKAIVEYLSSRRSLSREEYLFLMKLKGIRIDLVLLEEELLKLVREKDRRRVQLS